MAELKSLSHTHVALMDFMMANPTMHLADVAKNFGYTQPWLSQIIHSDAFQAMLAEKQGVAFHHTIMPIRDKMINTAHIALDKVQKMLEGEVDLRTANDVAEGMLDRLGYGSKPAGPGTLNVNIQQNNMVVPNSNAAEIARAREALLAARPALGVTVDGTVTLPRASMSNLGETLLESGNPSGSGENVAREGRNSAREESSFEVV